MTRHEPETIQSHRNRVALTRTPPKPPILVLGGQGRTAREMRRDGNVIATVAVIGIASALAWFAWPAIVAAWKGAM